MLLLAVGSAPAAAQWTWRGPNGQINASDRPPPREVPDKDILSRPPASAAARAPAAIASPAASAASAPPGALEREVEARKRAAEQEQAAKAKAEEAQRATVRAENCRRARAQQTAVESGQRLARVNDKGEREILDDKGRAEELRQARGVIESDCR